MDCKNTILRIDKFLKKEMHGHELEEFLDHVENCRECYEELETYYTVDRTLHYLDKNIEGSYNIPMAMKRDMRGARKRVRRMRLLRRLLGFLLVVMIAIWAIVAIRYLELPVGELMEYLEQVVFP